MRTAALRHGNEWASPDGGLHRIYINDLAGLYGLEVDTYGSGSVSSATLNGKKLSNNKAGRLLCDLDCAKLWWDDDRQTWASRGLTDEQHDTIVSRIMEEE